MTKKEKDNYGRVKKIHLRIGQQGNKKKITKMEKGIALEGWQEEMGVKGKKQGEMVGQEGKGGNTGAEGHGRIRRIHLRINPQQSGKKTETGEETKEEQDEKAKAAEEGEIQQKEDIEEESEEGETRIKRTVGTRKKFEESPWYRGVTIYLENGMEGLLEAGLGRNTRKAIANKGRRYTYIGEELFWRERDGSLAKCILEEEVEEVIRGLHDSHGHFAGGLTVGRAIGNYYWPTRERDIWEYCGSCDTCQRVGPRRKSGELRSIIQFKPFDMIGMDYVGPISPVCKKTGYKYILIMVDYFSRFLFARGFVEANQMSTLTMFFENVTPMFGWPMSVYCGNGTHFMGAEVQDTLRAFGVILGLSKRYVQMVIAALRRHCIAAGDTNADWSHGDVYKHQKDTSTRAYTIRNIAGVQC